MTGTVAGTDLGPIRFPPPFPADCRLVIFDLDGTLYHQGPVRRAMLLDLVLARGRPGRLARLRILGHFRRLREEMSQTAPREFDAQLFARLAAQTGWPEDELRALTHNWMELRPLLHLRRARIAGAAALFDALRNRGIAVAVWSDYPAQEKLAKLELSADHVISAGDADVAALKPDPAGLRLLLDRTDCPRDCALMIGDRVSHDGAAAAALGVQFLLRSANALDGVSRVADFRPLVRALRAP